MSTESKFAPYVRSNSTFSLLPYITARCNGVPYKLCLDSISAPNPRSSLVTFILFVMTE